MSVTIGLPYNSNVLSSCMGLPMKNLASIVLALGAAALAPAANAQAYPSKPIRLVVGFTPGAGINIANESVAESPPDGHTLLISTATVAISCEPKSRSGHTW
jgi:hypothetical protein